MRNFERTIIINMLSLGLVAGGTVLACSSSSSDGGDGDDAGVTTPTDEAGNAIDSSTSGKDGSSPDSSTPPTLCKKATDCVSGVCNLVSGVCAAASCKDGTKNATETDVDCGGACPKCDMQKTCKVAADCTSGVCTNPDGKGLKCQAPTNTDGVKNGNETGVDCGGTGNPPCADGGSCVLRTDCTSLYCKATVCTAVKPDDGVQDGDETDVDCGGAGAKACDDGKMCLAGTDCSSQVCDPAAKTCTPPSYTDNKLNGAETDVDCGGDPAYPCATGKICKVGGDCSSLGCDYNFKCAAGRSCTTHYGGDTCGQGGAGGIGAQAWESCCTTIPVTTAAGGTVYMDKYQVTAGRMRAFLEDKDVQYNVRAAVQTLRAAGQIPKIVYNASNAVDNNHPVLDPSWDMFLPVSFDGQVAGEISDCPQSGTCSLATGECPSSTTCTSEAVRQPGIYSAVRTHLGGNIFKNNSQTATGCFIGNGGPNGTHSFRFPDGKQDGGPADFNQDVYDTKTLNCVDNLMAEAFCVWDGGRLETYQEWQMASGAPNGNFTIATSVPWAPTTHTPQPVTIGSSSYYGCRFPWATDVDQHQCGLPHWAGYGGGANDGRSNQYADYQYSYEYPQAAGYDYIIYLTPPGRTQGRGPLGHADLLGAGFEQTSNVTWNAYVDQGAAAPTNTGPFAARHRWTPNGSWEVHAYGQQVTSDLLNKYGKLGARCVKFAPN